MRKVTAPILGVPSSSVNSLPRTRRLPVKRVPLSVPGIPRGTYSIITDHDGSRWLFCRRRSALDSHGRSHLLRWPRPSWAIPDAVLAAARKLGCVGVRIEDASTGLSYQAPFAVMDERGEHIQYPGFEPQRRLALRHWTVLGQESVVSAQLVLFPQQRAP